MADSAQTGDGQYQADIRWTTHGVPHITAPDMGGLGFGQGWACSRDHFAAILDHVVKVRSERARHLGRGEADKHLHTDLGYLALQTTQRAHRMEAAQGEPVRAIVCGYAAGVNSWFAEHGREALPQWCREASWIGPIEPIDLWRVYVDLSIMASGRNLVEYIGSAIAPGGPITEPIPAMPPEPFTADPGLASNAWAFGRAASVNGRGMVMANPHFPWLGEGRFWECHLQVPGELDVYGAALVGAPLVQMGFNQNIGWAHTFSMGSRFTVYKLELVAGRPTTYRYGDEQRDMVPTTLSIEVADEQSPTETTTVERTLWSTHYGPMLNLPMLGWSEAIGFTYRDANVDNNRPTAWTHSKRHSPRIRARRGSIPWRPTATGDAGMPTPVRPRTSRTRPTRRSSRTSKAIPSRNSPTRCGWCYSTDPIPVSNGKTIRSRPSRDCCRSRSYPNSNGMTTCSIRMIRIGWLTSTYKSLSTRRCLVSTTIGYPPAPA